MTSHEDDGKYFWGSPDEGHIPDEAAKYIHTFLNYCVNRGEPVFVTMKEPGGRERMFRVHVLEGLPLNQYDQTQPRPTP